MVAIVWSAALGGQAPAPSLPGTFIPDWTFKGSALTGTDQIGQVTWRAENGEIIGTPKSADGGWLLINPGYQDVQVTGSDRCAAECAVGVMLRGEKSASGIKGIYTTSTASAPATSTATARSI
jgi:hypothetical protein